jgi:hypothetical protein
VKATDGDLAAQYATASEIERTIVAVGAARLRARTLAKRVLTPGQLRILTDEVIGKEPADEPDDSMGKPSHDFSSFTYLDAAFSNLFDAVESADAAPTPDMLSAYKKLVAIYDRTLARLDAMERMR